MSPPLADFYRGKRVLVTGHTGFEGGWAAAWLKLLGAQVCGYGLPPATRPNFFDATILDRGMTSIFGDVRDRNSLASAFAEFQPEVVIHCAAQTSPRSSLREPVDAFSTNVMGTVHILEEARLTRSVRALVLVSNELETGSESETDTDDLYSATTSSAELARSAYNQCFFQKTSTAVATARIAEAIGGGDWREGRILPELVMGVMSGEPVRFNKERELTICHVLDAVHACLLLARDLFELGQKCARVWDFAPGDQGHIAASELARKFADLWSAEAPSSKKKSSTSPISKSKPDNSKAELGYSPVLSPEQALAWTVEWYRDFCGDPSSALRTTANQIEEYMGMVMTQPCSEDL
jgi:CDP-glucose 4,6-dehydratase